MHHKVHKKFAEDKQSIKHGLLHGLLDHAPWSDETKKSFGSDGVQFVWRQTGEEYQDYCLLPSQV